MTVTFQTESWLWFGIVMVMVVLRFTSRVLHFKSLTRFQLEDYLMLFIAIAYVIFIVLINICVEYNTNLIDPSDIPNLTPKDIADRTYGSKLILGVEQTMCIIQWGTKACLLFLYYRLTENLVQNLLVKAVGAYVLVTFVVMEALYLGYWCRPFSDYWETPTDNVQCTTALHHLIVNLSFNLTSDILVMSIPLPLLVRAHLEIKRKIILCFPFTLGFFSIICAILSKHVSFTHPFSPLWVYWYTREASCVMIVANMPYTWGLARRAFKMRSFFGRASNESRSDSMIGEYTDDARVGNAAVEIREIQGFGVNMQPETTDIGKGRRVSAWARFSNLLGDEKLVKRPAPAIIVETQPISEKSSPSVTQSSASTSDEPWKNVTWTKSDTDVHISQAPTNQSPISPNCLMPPTAVCSSNNGRPSSADSRRSSTADVRRMSTFSSRRHHRASVAELSRHTTRTSTNVDAVDRLYRLDDDELIADLEAARPRSQNDGFA